MKVELFDLEEFFSDKYINVDNKLGLCGLSVITQNQMVSRTGIEVGSISKVASHLEIEGSIMHDIFGFDKRI